VPVSVPVVIVGAPASGKTTVGRALSAELDVDFHETDDIVAARLGMPVAEVFLVHGEAVFRKAEVAAVAQALGENQGVLALGSGAIQSPETRALLANESVVWLQLASLDAAKRAGITGARPVQLGGVRSQWARLMADREPLYAEVADLTVDTGALDVSACVTRITEKLSDQQGVQ
jgi:shikimate kinase